MTTNREPDRIFTTSRRGDEPPEEGVPEEREGEPAGKKRDATRHVDPYTPVRPGGPVPDELRRDPSDDGVEM